MGNCCNGAEGLVSTKEQIILQKSLSRLNVIGRMKQRKPDADETVFIEKVNQFLSPSSFQEKLQTLHNKLHREKSLSDVTFEFITLEQLWNICKHFEFNHALSTYVVLEMREQLNSFVMLRHFKQLSYSIDELITLEEGDPEKFERIKLFLMFRTLIVIMPESKILELEKFVVMMNRQKFFVKILILNQDTEADDIIQLESAAHLSLVEKEQLKTKFLFQQVDSAVFRYLPSILFSLKYFRSVGSNKMIFFDFYDENNKLFKAFTTPSTENWMSVKLADFIDFFRLGACYFITTEVEDTFISNKIEKSSKCFITYEMKNITDLTKKLSKLMRILEYLNELINRNKSIFIILDKRIRKELMVNLILLLSFKLTNTKIAQTLEYAKDNFVFVEQFEKAVQDNRKSIEDFFEANVYSTNSNFRCGGLVNHKYSSSIITSPGISLAGSRSISRLEATVNLASQRQHPIDLSEQNGNFCFTNPAFETTLKLNHSNIDINTEVDSEIDMKLCEAPKNRMMYLKNNDAVGEICLPSNSNTRNKTNDDSIYNEALIRESQAVLDTGKANKVATVVDSGYDTTSINDCISIQQSQTNKRKTLMSSSYSDYLKQLRADVGSYPHFILITSTLNRLVNNILANYKDSKFRRVKINSPAFANIFLCSKYSLQLLESFDFEEEHSLDNQNDQFFICKSECIEALKKKQIAFNQELNSYLTN